MTTEATREAREEVTNIYRRMQAGKLLWLQGLSACRERSGLTQKQAAMLCGVVDSTYRSWEAGKNWPNGYHMPILAAALGCSFEELFLGPRDQEGGEP